MTAVLLIIAVTALSVAAFAAVGHLARIADAVEAQNCFYGIGQDTASEEQPTERPTFACDCGTCERLRAALNGEPS